MTGTIWTVGGSESKGNFDQHAALNCRRQIAVWQGFLDADDNVALDYTTPEEWDVVRRAIEAKYGIDSTYADMIGPDLEYGGWSSLKDDGPYEADGTPDPDWAAMAHDLGRCVADFRAAWPNAAAIKSYNLPAANKWQRDEDRRNAWMSNQRSLIRACPALTHLLTVLYSRTSRPNYNVPYYRPAVEDMLELAAEFGMVPVAHIGYRFSPGGAADDRFTLVPPEEFRTMVREVIFDAEYAGTRCNDIGVWDQAKWEWSLCQRTNPDGTPAITTARQNHIRAVLTAELTEAGVTLGDPVSEQAYWDEVALTRYVIINEAMGWELPAEPPKVVPIGHVEVIGKSAAGVTERMERANAHVRDAAAACAAHEQLIAKVLDQ